MDLEKFRSVLQAAEGHRLGIAWSGGSDSTALLNLALEHHEVHAIHVDHGLREGSSEQAQELQRQAEKLGIEITVVEAKIQRAPRESLEQAARRLRYQALTKAAQDSVCDFVATGHTLDDQAETVLLRLIRGAGTRGMAGIPARRDIFLRPLLTYTRSELQAWLNAEGIKWTTDESNSDLSFERNWIRHEVLPLLASRRAGVARVLARHAYMARDDNTILDGLADEVLQQTNSRILSDEMLDLPAAVSSRVVRKALESAGGRFHTRTINSVLDLKNQPIGTCVQVSANCRVRRTQHAVEVLCES